MGFGDSVEASAKRMQEQVNTKINTIATELFNQTVTLTPVNQLMMWRGKRANRGELINNWYVGVGPGVINKSYNYGAANPTGIGSYGRIAQVINEKEFVGKDGAITLTNSTPYGFRAEYAGWPTPQWSGRAKPYAMVRNALSIIASKYK